jgi:hypothetical protein
VPILVENLQPLGTDVRAKDAVAGDISSRSGEAWHEPGAHGIANRDHDDGNRGGGLLGRETCGRAVGRNDIHRAPNERRRGLGEPFRHSVAMRIVEDYVAAFEVPEIPQPVPEGVPPERVVDDADARDLRRLLRARRERPRGRTPEQRDERAAPHSITSSARSRMDVGTWRPIALAVLRLTAISNFTGACTGKSLGFSPLRMRSTYEPARRNRSPVSGP